ncbi:MAG TPA: GtrA family protein [Vicinamibacterales bacterium]|nr:GtrA family protein [Vicinamibacterales bacterium]
MSLVSFVLSRAQRLALAGACRFGTFLIVGWIGFALQLTALALMTSLAHWPWLPATIVAVELAVVHNFVWHERVTWADRKRSRAAFARALRRASPELAHVARERRRVARFVRFNVATGITSIGGNVALMAVYVGVLGLPPVIANAIAVATMSLVNFFVADRWVFRGATPAVAILLLTAAAASAGPRAGTIEAWNRHVADTEARLERSATASRADAPTREIQPQGESIGVPSGTISRWRGSVFIPGVRLDDVLDRLQHPGTPPPQDDVVSSRVIARGHDSLRVFIRLVRHAIVTVTYDTEHEMTFRRRTPAIATARSVATRIDEVGGGDRGFLWRLNSYWRYEQIDGGVRVDLESLTLSRDVPSLVRPIASPIVSRIARESMVSTLDALRKYLSPVRL